MGRHWFEDLADHLGTAYLGYSFTRGTLNEVDALWDLLHLRPGSRVLDLGCGPGRHAIELAQRGVLTTGLDRSATFLAEAATRAKPLPLELVRADGRHLPFASRSFDAVISICQGAFGLNRSDPGNDPEAGSPLDPDLCLLQEVHRCLRIGGRLALTAFSAFAQVLQNDVEPADKAMAELSGSRFDPATGLNRERTEIRNPAGDVIPVDLWTTCFTPREMALMARSAGLVPELVWSVAPGRWVSRPPDLDRPEYLQVSLRLA